MTVNVPNVHKIYQHLALQVPPKFSQIWIFGLKICHLATLYAGSGQRSLCPVFLGAVAILQLGFFFSHQILVEGRRHPFKVN
jgi:hypothetical protein